MVTGQDTHTALIVGSTGIVGGNLAAHLVDRGWRVYGLARKPSTADGIIPIAADLRDETSVRNALAGIEPTHVFLCTWLRQPTEAENVRVNGGMTRHLFAALENAKEHHSCRSRDRHQAIPWAVRVLRPDRRRDALSRGHAETPGRKLLLHPGRHSLRCGRTRWLQLERPPSAQHRGIRAGQRDEHGCHPRRLRDHLPRDQAALCLSRLPSAVECAHRRDRRPPSRTSSGVGRHVAPGSKPGTQCREWRCLSLAMALAATRCLLRRGACRPTGPDPAASRKIRRCREPLAVHRGQAFPRRAATSTSWHPGGTPTATWDASWNLSTT